MSGKRQKTTDAGSAAASAAAVSSLPPSPRLDYNLGPDAINRVLASIEQRFGADLAAIVDGSRLHDGVLSTFASTYGALDAAFAEAAVVSAQCTLPSLVSMDPEARKASAAAKKRLQKMFDAAMARQDLYAAMQTFTPPPPGPPADLSFSLTSQEERLRSILDADFERRGAQVTDAGRREELTRIGTLVTELGGGIESNINEDTTTIALTPAELEGVPRSALDAFPRGSAVGGGAVAGGGEEHYIVGMKAPTRLPVMRFAKDQATRFVEG
jgi:Zn-dependent oligopeptidase